MISAKSAEKAIAIDDGKASGNAEALECCRELLVATQTTKTKYAVRVEKKQGLNDAHFARPVSVEKSFYGQLHRKPLLVQASQGFCLAAG